MEETKVLTNQVVQSLLNGTHFRNFIVEFPEFANAEYVVLMFEEAEKLKSSVDIECLSMICSLCGLCQAYVPVFNTLLVAQWHRKHEDIARYLQELRDERCIEAAVKAINTRLEYLYAVDESSAFIRKCAYILGDLSYFNGSIEAYKELQVLVESDNQIISDSARHQIQKIFSL